MQLYDHHAVEDRLDWSLLIENLRQGFARATVEAPPRQVLSITQPDGTEASLLIMPAWEGGKAIGVKVVTFFPGNAAQGKATINAGFLMFDGADGRFVSAMDGDALTARRTAAASALAADYLARKDARRLLVLGTGQLAAAVAQAHAKMRNYSEVAIWGRSIEKAETVVEDLCRLGLPAIVCTDLEAGCRAADVVSSVTASTSPFIRGEWLSPGSHLDLIGAFKADMRECDDLALTQADVFVDGRAGAVLAGDLAQPIAGGLFDASRILGDLTELVQGRVEGRRDAASRTLFKSVGMSQEDLIAAIQVSGLG
ncbi:ornithine cyclodeaminase family protein [Paracoccus sp. MBLB3053]|uniref:Ornithine cyclodeaminase family protein n=1 Tax=Paracoccus aurantius TaxID=3073814 RepID=A0ABU2HWA9_9RHOB|nr:ornithine cyclodeaminase family protein [Paracoccus sp. MBLB3053]MDS9469007.1 ornithine cyclodeaminase family protein [Paracoccus sp. MBLB3053]